MRILIVPLLTPLLALSLGGCLARAAVDVVSLPVLSGRMLLSGPDGRLSTVREDADVVVQRSAPSCED